MTIPLNPGRGGKSIDERSLEIADIIVSTTPAAISRVIRGVTGSSVSHSMLYIGGGQVVEAISDGVTMRTLGQALAEASLAVAYRRPRTTMQQGLVVRDFVGQKINKGYNFLGLVGGAGFQLDRAVFCVDANIECIQRVGNLNMKLSSKDRFFCSELVLAGFKRAGIPLTNTPPDWNSPDDIARLRLTGSLQYVGHIKA